MRKLMITVAAASLILVSGAASAGSLTYSNGQSQWQSTRCNEPAEPSALAALNSETSASEVNSLMETYNAYAHAMQGYMDCISSEAQGDSDAAGQAIISSAQATIGSAQRKVQGLSDTLQSKR